MQCYIYIYITTWYENIKENQEETIKFYKWFYLVAYLHNYVGKIRNKKKKTTTWSERILVTLLDVTGLWTSPFSFTLGSFADWVTNFEPGMKAYSLQKKQKQHTQIHTNKHMGVHTKKKEGIFKSQFCPQVWQPQCIFHSIFFADMHSSLPLCSWVMVCLVEMRLK